MVLRSIPSLCWWGVCRMRQVPVGTSQSIPTFLFLSLLVGNLSRAKKDRSELPDSQRWLRVMLYYTHTHTHTHTKLAPHNDGLSWMESWGDLLMVLKQKLQKRQWLQDYVGLFGTDSCPNTMAKYGSEKLEAFSTNSLNSECVLWYFCITCHLLEQ